jgi:hypothetical protein
MHRSRTQIATVYAPGALFTYEGGLGCCLSVSYSTPYDPSTPAVQKQLFEHLAEYVESWFERAMRCRKDPEVLPEQCIDTAFLDHNKEPRIDSGRFALNQPSRMGFIPDPLVFICSDCGRLSEFDNIEDLHRRWHSVETRDDCAKSDSHRHSWRQMDVIFAHWSGNYCGLSPHRWVMSPDGNVSQVKKCKNCGHGEYQLAANASPFFSDWKFQCVKCLTSNDVVQADRDTLKLLKPRMDAGHGNLAKEWNMLPVSYRASQVFYVQTDSFILFRDTDVTTLLSAARRVDLVSRLMALFDFPGTPLTHEEIIRQLRENGRIAEADDFKQVAEIATALPAAKLIIDKQLDEKRARYEASGIIALHHQQSPTLSAQAESSQEWARRFNPVRLAIEHAALRTEIVDRQGTDPSLPAISVLNPDVCDIEQEDATARASYTSQVKQALVQLGMDEMVLLRGLDICEFSFGYTRVGSTPSITEKEREMPVCLRAFGYSEKNKRPIYVLEQKNEAFYVRLSEQRVIEWLRQNGLNEKLPPRDGMRLGGLLIEEYVDFGRFLEQYKERTAEGRTSRSVPNFVYLLLHTMAHHFGQALVEYSGLEHGSLGEYLFPADLAFLVYRRGMTPDLGNLSAMWRNCGHAVLDHLLSDRALKCDSGSLCDQRGGACPACIMAPEVACLAGNNLLSRSALRGGPPPGWDSDRRPLVGYFRVQNPGETVA